MKAQLVLAFAILAALAPALAKAPLGPDDISAGTYVVDGKETLVRYGTIHMGFTEFWGTFPGATGTLVIDPKDIAATKLDVSVPVARVSTTSDELDGALVSPMFFDAGKYPLLRFVANKVERTGATTAKVTGTLTMHGVSKEVVLNVMFNGAGPNLFTKVPTIGFKAEGTVKRSDFGLSKFVPIVSDETTITISAAFEKR